MYDIWKAQKCKVKDIDLICVPHIYTFKDRNKMKKYIEDQLVLKGRLF